MLKKGIVFLLLGWLIMLFNGCSTTSKDGPPSYPVDVSNIQNAVPKNEKMSKTGNKPYTVFGKRYYVMPSSNNYKERGVASWYGKKFHKRSTSSGEPYNMLAMTAAHKTLPLPTYVEVKNLSNNRTIIVKVNDRGPFEGKRLIDLSYAAAKKLGMLGKGTAAVEVTAINPNQYYAKQKTVAPMITENHPSPSNVYLQIGAFRNKAYAERLQKKLSNILDSPVQITQLNKPKSLYRVQIGPLKDRATLAHVNKQLKLIGLNGREVTQV